MITADGLSVVVDNASLHAACAKGRLGRIAFDRRNLANLNNTRASGASPSHVAHQTRTNR